MSTRPVLIVVCAALGVFAAGAQTSAAAARKSVTERQRETRPNYQAEAPEAKSEERVRARALELAQEHNPSDQPEAQLSEIVVTTTRIPRRIADEPTRIEVVGPEEIREQTAESPGNVSMLLNETSGLHVQITSPGLAAANVRIEGLPGRYTQILADGLPLYGGQASSMSLLQIPPLDLGRVEIIKGVASALYGASALGGVINFISRRPDGKRELLLNETSRQGTDMALWWSGTPARVGWTYSVSANADRQVEQDADGDGWADIPGYRRAVITPRLYWSDEAGRKLYLIAGALLEDRTGGTLAGGRVPSGDPNGAPFYEALKTRQYDAGLTSQWPLSRKQMLTVRASFMDRGERLNFGGSYEPSDYRTALVDAAVNGTAGTNRWVTGLSFEEDQYRDQALPAFDFTYLVPALFAQDEINIGRSVILSAGGRVDAHSQYGTFFSPRLAALWRPGGRASPWRVRLSLGGGFYAPTPLTGETDATGLTRILPLRNLNAERAQGASVDLDRLWALPHGLLETDLTVFGSEVAHAVDLVQMSASPPRFAFVNDPRPMRALGTELLVSGRSGPFEFTTIYNYTDSTEVEPDSISRITVPLNPRHSGIVTVSWEKERIGSIGLEALFTGRQTLTGTLTPNPYRTTSPSFVMFGVLLERKVGPVTVFLNGENLTDRRLTRFQPLVLPAQAHDGRWTTDAWGPLDGRVISLGVRWRFGELSRGRSTEDRDGDEPSDLERPILDDSGKP